MAGAINITNQIVCVLLELSSLLQMGDVRYKMYSCTPPGYKHHTVIHNNTISDTLSYIFSVRICETGLQISYLLD